MDNIVYLTENCYIDTGEKIINQEKPSENPPILSDIPLKIFQILWEHKGKTVTYKDLAEAVYGKAENKSTAKLDIENIKKAKGRLKTVFIEAGLKDAEIDSFLYNVRGKGYVFKPYSVSFNISEQANDYLNKLGLPKKDLSDMIDVMLMHGISGKMGRHSLKMLAAQNNEYAIFELGELAYYGYLDKNHQANYKAAHDWYVQAPNHPGALWTLGYMIVGNKYPQVPRDQIDYGKALEYFERANEATGSMGGFPPALNSIGQLWYEGHYPCNGFTPMDRKKCRFENVDVQKALEYYKRADKMGYHYATNRIARHYERVGAYKSAYKWFKRSLELVQDGYANNKIGSFYENTNIQFPHDPGKACEYYLRSINCIEEDVTAWCLYNAGRVYARLIKDQPNAYQLDLDKAFELFNRALRKAEVQNHFDILITMLDILLYHDLSTLSEEKQKYYAAQTMRFTEHYLARADAADKSGEFAKVPKITGMYEALKENR